MGLGISFVLVVGTFDRGDHFVAGWKFFDQRKVHVDKFNNYKHFR